MFYGLDNSISNKFMNWDGKDILAFSRQFDADDYYEMHYFSKMVGFDCVGDIEYDTDIATEGQGTERHIQMIQMFVKDCLMVAIMGEAFNESVNQDKVVKKLYDIWNKQSSNKKLIN